MFEKSLVDLIRGLRTHKGNESDYIHGALKECRGEIRSQDMDVKATALLKLIYLEMFGYDMTWAAFNVLEVMSSAKHFQKRVGYLAAVQSFRPDTEVLMLATNLLKKDLSSPLIPIMTLPLITLPHIITSSLALSILTDMLPRLGHSQPSVRKKTIVSLYRLALVYPETLRVAWPKIKERLLDEQENSSVTAATVNVVCELGWRRPRDFLPLAPRLFDLLIEGGNNWMAIKIIKLFAVLTPLEPRLVKKLVRPLTNLIQSTSAMSLLYECISGIIQGGILDGGHGGTEQDEVADLCISKLRGMIVLDGDPNLKYVALLAFNKIAISHAELVSLQQDVVLACLDDPDISIRLQALELVTGIVNSDNLQSIVNRLVKQLSNSPVAPGGQADGRSGEASVDAENTDLEQKLVADKRGSEAPPLPSEYRQGVLERILDMCSHSTYANITDFEWYIETLVRLVRLVPSSTSAELDLAQSDRTRSEVANRIGSQILDIAIRVRELRPETTKAAESLVLISNRASMIPADSCGAGDILRSVAWVAGEFPAYLNSAHDTLNSLIHESSLTLPTKTLASYVHAIPKVFSCIAAAASRSWGPAQKTTISLQLARTIDFLDKLSSNPSLDVQERSAEYLELLRLVSEALSSQSADSIEAPLLLTSVIPGLFSDGELNPVAVGAQHKVPLPDEIDLDAPINTELQQILQRSQMEDDEDPHLHEFHAFYNERETPNTSQAPAIKVVEPDEHEPLSYQQPEDPQTRAKRKAERSTRNKDDPFYIPPSGNTSGRSSPFHDILSRENGEDFDVDSIPIINLQLDHDDAQAASRLEELRKQQEQPQKRKKKPIKKFSVAADETVDEGPAISGTHNPSARSAETKNGITSSKPVVRPKANLLSVDSSNLRQFSLEAGPESDPLEIERREAEEAEMAAAIREVERLRLEMQRAAERTEAAEGVDLEGTVVKKKKRRKPKDTADEVVGDAADGVGQLVEGEVVKKKKKKKKKIEAVLEADE